MTPVPIHDPDDARVADYRQIRERDLTGRRGLFVAEGAVVLNVLASPRSRCRAVSALIAEQRVEPLRPVLEQLDAPVYAAGQRDWGEASTFSTTAPSATNRPRRPVRSRSRIWR